MSALARRAPIALDPAPPAARAPLAFPSPATITTITARRFDPGLAAVVHRKAGATIAEIVAEEFSDATPDQLARLVVVIVSETAEWEVYAQFWARVRPAPGMVVRLHVRLASRTLIRSVLSVVIFAAAAFLGPLLLPGFGALATAGIAALGTLALNALLPIEPPKSPGKPEERYSISGGRNEARPYGRIPEIHGKIRFYPLYASLPYSDSIGEDRYMRFLYNLGYADSVFTDWKVGETPLAEYPDHELLVVKHSPGDPWPFAGFSNPVFETEEKIDLKSVEGWQTRRSARNVDFISLEFLFEEGLGNYNKKGRLDPNTVSFEIRRREVLDDGTFGPWVPVKTITLTRETRDPFRVSHAWLEPHHGTWDHSCRRLTEDRPSGTDRLGKVSWIVRRGTRPVVPVVFNRPIHLAYLRIKATPQANGTLDRVSCVASSIRKDFDVPTGTWVVRETQSPAAHGLRVLQGPGNPFPANDDEIRLPDYEELARFAYAKGLKVNVVHDDDRTVETALKQVLRGGRAFPTRHDGVRSLFIDRPQTIVRGHLAAVNATNFAGDPTYEEPVDALRVTFADETDGFRRTERIVPRPGLVGEPQSFEEVDFKVYTDPRLNWIEATRLHLERKYRWERFFADQDAEHLFAPPGSLVKAHFTTVKQRHASARVRSVEGQFVVLSQAVKMEDGLSYAVRFRTKSGLSYVRSVLTVAGESRSLCLLGAGRTPDPGDIAMFGIEGKEAEDVIVKEIEGQRDLRARLTLVPHAPQIEAEAEANVPDWFPIIPIPRPWADEPPATPIIVSVTTRATVIDDDDGVINPSDNPIVVVVVKEGVGGAPTDTILVKVGSRELSVTVGIGVAEFDDFDVGDDVSVTAQAFSVFNKFSAVSEPTPYRVERPVPPPPNVTSFSLTRLSDGTRRFTYGLDANATPSELEDVAGVRIYGRPGAGWAFEDLEPIHNGLVVSSPAEMREPLTTGPHVFAAVAVEAAGAESATPILIAKTIGGSVGPALLSERSERALNWPGFIGGGAIVSGGLRGTAAGGVLVYRTPVIDLGADLAVDIGASLYGVEGAAALEIRTGLTADGSVAGLWGPPRDATARYVQFRATVTPATVALAAIGDLVTTVSPI